MVRRTRILTCGVLISVRGAFHAEAQCEDQWCSIAPLHTQSVVVRTVEAFGIGAGPKLYIGGLFGLAGQAPAEHLATWDGARFTPIMPGATGSVSGTPCYVNLLRVLDDGSGAALFAGGTFLRIGGVDATMVARFDGTVWTAITNELRADTSMQAFSNVHALEYFDTGAGPELYIAGCFSFGTHPANRAMAKVTPAGLMAVGTGWVSQPVIGFPCVGSLLVYDDGSGALLYAGGSFSQVGGVQAQNIARWNGTAWSAAGSGLALSGRDANVVPTVSSLLSWQTDSGRILLAAGDIEVDGVRGIARWDGATWSSFASDFAPNGVVKLSQLEIGSGLQLYASGRFQTINGQALSMAARYAPDSPPGWEPIGAGFVNGQSGPAYFVSSFDEGAGPRAFIGGRDLRTAGDPAVGNALLRLGPPVGDLDCDYTVGLSDLATLLAAFGESDAGDIDGDGQTTLADLAVLLSSYGSACQ